MEIVFGIACIAFVLLIGYHCMKESDETKRRKEFAAERIRRMQREREVQAEAEYLRQAARVSYQQHRHAPITTGKPATKASPRSSGGSTELKRHDNSFDNVVDTYSAPAYTPSHSSSSSYSSCSSSSSSSSDSSSSSSSSSSCD